MSTNFNDESQTPGKADQTTAYGSMGDSGMSASLREKQSQLQAMHQMNQQLKVSKPSASGSLGILLIAFFVITGLLTWLGWQFIPKYIPKPTGILPYFAYYLPLGVIGFNLFIFGLIFGTKSIKQYRLSKKRTSVTPGVVLSSYIKKYRGGRTSTGGSSTTYKVFVDYEFEIDGVSQQASYENGSSQHNIMSMHQKTLDYYHPGKGVEVYYDPGDVQNSDLVQDKGKKGTIIWLTILFGPTSVMLGGAISMFILSR